MNAKHMDVLNSQQKEIIAPRNVNKESLPKEQKINEMKRMLPDQNYFALCASKNL